MGSAGATLSIQIIAAITQAILAALGDQLTHSAYHLLHALSHHLRPPAPLLLQARILRQAGHAAIQFLFPQCVLAMDLWGGVGDVVLWDTLALHLIRLTQSATQSGQLAPRRPGPDRLQRSLRQAQRLPTHTH